MRKGWATKIAGSMVEREILKAVEFWYPKARPMRGGFRWLVWSIPEWQVKVGTHASDKTIRRALTNLREQGVLLSERHRHPYVHNGGQVLWVRPNEAVIDRLLTEIRPVTDRSLTETIYTDNSLQSSGVQAHSGKPQGADQEDQVKGADFLAKKKVGASVASGLAVFAGKKTEVQADMPNTPQMAHNCLRDACLAAGYAAPGSFNKMRGGQMKTMVNRMVDQGLTRAEIRTLLFFVCGRWPEFINWSKDKYNVTVKGTAPNHSSLTMFAVEAVGFWQTYTAAQETVKETDGGVSTLDQAF